MLDSRAHYKRTDPARIGGTGNSQRLPAPCAPAAFAPASFIPAAFLLAAFALVPLAATAAPSTRSVITADGEGIGFKARRQASEVLPATPAIDMTRFSFTAAGARSPTRLAAFERGFQFTPSGGGDKRNVAVGVTTRSSAPVVAAAQQARAASAGAAIGPESYGFDLAVGWKGLAVSGGVARSITAAGSETDGVGLGLSYGRKGWRTGLRATAERGSALLPQSNNSATERMAFEATGALHVAPSVSLGGTLRYQLAPIHPTPLDPNKEDRAVFLGGRVNF